MRTIIIGTALSVLTAAGAVAQQQPRLRPIGVFGPTSYPIGPSAVYGSQVLILNNGQFELPAVASGAYYGQAFGSGSAQRAYHNANDSGYVASSCAYYSCNTLLGNEEYAHDFFVFNLSDVSVPIFGATLSIGNLEADTGKYVSWDVTTPIGLLEQSWIGPTGGFSPDPEALTIFNDVGSGVVYGSTSFSPADDSNQVIIPLSPLAVQSINVAEGGSWAVGGSVVPELSSWVLTAAGFGAIGYVYGQRRKALVRPESNRA